MALIDSLVAFWSLEEASGPRADSKSTNTLDDNNSVGSATGIVGNGADFERGTPDQALTHADSAVFSRGDTDFTFQAWVKLESKPAATSLVIIGKDDDIGGGVFDAEYYLYVRNVTGNFVWEVYGTQNYGSFARVEGLSPSIATWYHLIAIHDSVNDLIKIIVNDGTPVTQVWGSGVYNGNSRFWIGNDPPNYDDGFDGVIDQVGLWSRVLSASEITQLYNGGAGLSYIGMGGGHYFRLY